MEYGLSLYNLIPEGVFQMTSVTTKKTQRFDSPVATFNYQHIKPSLMFGYTLRETEFGKICIAEREKVLLDFLYLTPKANSIDYFNEMRLNKDELKKLDISKLKSYLAVMNQQALSQRTKRLLEYVANR